MKKQLFFILLVILSFEVSASVGKKQLRVRLEDTLTNLADEMDLYLDIGLSPAFLPNEDSPKNFDSVLAVPQIYSFTSNGVRCYSNTYGDFNRTVRIGVGIRVGAAGTFAFTAPKLDNFDPTSIILLEDKQTGALHDLREGAYIMQLNQPAQIEGRFFLIISFPPLITSIPSGCNNDDGVISVLEDTTIIWSACQLYDSSMALHSAYNGIKGNFHFAGLPEGNYNLAFVYGIYSVVKPVHINGNQITASVEASYIYASVGQQIMFHSNAHNATAFVWEFGDSTTITGVANVEYAYSAPGTYTVAVQCSNNRGCSAYSYVTVYITGNLTSVGSALENNLKMWTANKSLFLVNNTSSDYLFEIHTLSGQLINTGSLYSSPLTINLQNQPSGVYIVHAKNPEGNLTKKIFLE